jgi:hypothetical protein
MPIRQGNNVPAEWPRDREALANTNQMITVSSTCSQMVPDTEHVYHPA